MKEVTDKYPAGRASLTCQMLNPTRRCLTNCPNMAGNQGPFVLNVIETYADGTAVLEMLANRVPHRILGRLYNYSGQKLAQFPLRDIATRMAMAQAKGGGDKCDSIRIDLSTLRADMQTSVVAEAPVAVEHRVQKMKQHNCDM